MKVHFEIVNEKPTTHRWWVYVHTTPDGMHYVGVSSQEKTWMRWQPSNYKGMSLWSYIEKYGWENIEHTVVAYLDNEKLALLYEDALIKEFEKQGTLINKQGSGGHWRDNPKECRCEYQHRQRERAKAARRKKQSKHMAPQKVKIYNRVAAFNRCHPDLAVETPLEAKQRYLQEGIIPSYIKKDDLE